MLTYSILAFEYPRSGCTQGNCATNMKVQHYKAVASFTHACVNLPTDGAAVGSKLSRGLHAVYLFLGLVAVC